MRRLWLVSSLAFVQSFSGCRDSTKLVRAAGEPNTVELGCKCRSSVCFAIRPEDVGRHVLVPTPPAPHQTPSCQPRELTDEDVGFCLPADDLCYASGVPYAGLRDDLVAIQAARDNCAVAGVDQCYPAGAFPGTIKVDGQDLGFGQKCSQLCAAGTVAEIRILNCSEVALVDAPCRSLFCSRGGQLPFPPFGPCETLDADGCCCAGTNRARPPVACNSDPAQIARVGTLSTRVSCTASSPRVSDPGWCANPKVVDPPPLELRVDSTQSWSTICCLRMTAA